MLRINPSGGKRKCTEKIRRTSPQSWIGHCSPRAWSFISFYSRRFIPGSNSNHTLSLENLQVSVLKLFDAKLIIYRESFTQWSGAGQVEIQYLYYAEMKITIDSIELKKEKTSGVKWEEKRREKKNRKETKRNRQGCENNFHSLPALTSAYAYQCGLVVRAHPASSETITLRFPTIGSPACHRKSPGRLRRLPPLLNQLHNPKEISTDS